MNSLRSSLLRIGYRMRPQTNRGFSLTGIVGSDNSQKISATHRVDNLEKRFLVWTGKYKRVEDVPVFVAPDVMERARNRMRIRISNIMIALTLVGCGVMVWSGKRARDRGETVEKQNQRWHEQMKQEAEARESKSGTTT